jgi:CheY-like chemotaxis protein
VPILAVTAMAMDGDRERCLSAGATDYLTKPVGLRRLEAIITRLLAARAAPPDR